MGVHSNPVAEVVELAFAYENISPACYAVIVSLGEGIYTRSQLKQNAKGRPAMLTLITTTLALAAVRLSLFVALLRQHKVAMHACSSA